MPGFIAKKLCPNLVIMPTNFDKYRAVSAQVCYMLVPNIQYSWLLSISHAWVCLKGTGDIFRVWPSFYAYESGRGLSGHHWASGGAEALARDHANTSHVWCQDRCVTEVYWLVQRFSKKKVIWGLWKRLEISNVKHIKIKLNNLH